MKEDFLDKDFESFLSSVELQEAPAGFSRKLMAKISPQASTSKVDGYNFLKYYFGFIFLSLVAMVSILIWQVDGGSSQIATKYLSSLEDLKFSFFKLSHTNLSIMALVALSLIINIADRYNNSLSGRILTENA